MRRRQDNRVDAGICEHRPKPTDVVELMGCRVFAMPTRIAADRLGKAQPFALALNRLDEGLAPPPETDNRGVDHRQGSRALRAASTEMLGEEGKDPSWHRTLAKASRISEAMVVG